MVSTRQDMREFMKNENSSLHFDGLRTPLCVLNARLSNVDPGRGHQGSEDTVTVRL
jgi:hypothetical protein